ncbi:unnamed protein product [Plasmodium vivax]|uniref:Tryptophan/threonine-rich plasmodium antigen C-terminal domain-containing protein n=2 Tax=Plasmodium vivax TaxID=5855 RepID=A0A0J9T7V8_PLAVI|nr:hypothetical protein PVMG_04843 [Plasmodium vivax Mauritania I]CAG9485441.1 unnamed protein product [Plasmodium vivax]SCA83435.1 tryptophan-rich antigen [Plasmodium vivax]
MRGIEDMSDFDIEKWARLLEDDWNSFVEFKTQEMEKLEREYRHEWNIWLRRFEPEWMDFKGFMVNKKRIWIQKKEYEWNKWVKTMENKWRDEIEKMNKNNYPNDNGNDNHNDVNSQIKNMMINDLKKWINTNESNLYRWILRDWDIWKKNRLEEWTKSDWKVKENKYWTEWEKKDPWKEYLYIIKMTKWLKWRERLKRERRHWIELTEKIENMYIVQNHMDWEKWKNDKITWFKEWMRYFIEECMTEESRNLYLDQ